MDHCFGDALGHLDDRRVMASLPAVLETRTHGFRADKLQLALCLLILRELFDQCSVPNLLQIRLLSWVRDSPTPVRVFNEVLIEDRKEFEWLLVLFPDSVLPGLAPPGGLRHNC